MASFFAASYFPDVVINSLPTGGSGEVSSAGKTSSDADLDSILKRNFFDPNESVFSGDQKITQQVVEPEKVETHKPSNTEAIKTTLPVNLVSTVVVGDGQNNRSSCVIRYQNKQDVYTLASAPSFAPETKIVRILPKRVEFMNKDQLEYVELADALKSLGTKVVADRGPKQPTRLPVEKDTADEATTDSGPIARTGNNFKIPRSEVVKAMQNLNVLFTQIRAVPYYAQGRPAGLKLLDVKGHSLFEQLGLHKGDILKSINGNTLEMSRALQLFQQLQNEQSFTMDVTRRGQDDTYSYDIVD